MELNLNTEDDNNENVNDYINNEIDETNNKTETIVHNTEINNLKKLKIGQLVDKLIHKQTDINNIIEKKITEENKENKKNIEDIVVTRRRKNKIFSRH
jgi:hypothetical protein